MQENTPHKAHINPPERLNEILFSFKYPGFKFEVRHFLNRYKTGHIFQPSVIC